MIGRIGCTGLAALAVSGALAAALPAAGAAQGPVAGLQERLPAPAPLGAAATDPLRPIPTGAVLVSEIAGDLGERSVDARARTARLGLIGGLAATFRRSDGSVAARAWAAQLGARGGAQAGVDLTRWSLRAAGAEVVVSELERPAGGLVLDVTRPDGSRAAVVAFALEGWLYGVELPAAPGGAPDLVAATAAGARLAARLPRLALGGPRPLGVSPLMRLELAAARAGARGARRGGTEPVPGTVQAAADGDVEWALASFEGRGAELEVFRRRAGAAWTALGDPGGPGCPRVPAAIQAVWGLLGACPAGASPVTRPDDPDAADPDLSPLRGPGMWVWEVRAAGGAERIAADATAAGFRTVFLKSGDGVRYWRQFDAALPVLRAAGLRVCAWQYVYGRSPAREARVLARAERRGADCLVVDAESEMERGTYNGSAHRAARSYMRELRRRVRRRVPVAMTTFAYVDLHRSFPYSAFAEGANAVDAFMPQVYWGAFRTRMASALTRSMRWNAVYGLPVAPIAGTYRGERPSDLRAFRCLAADLGADGVSYWSLQHTRRAQLPALALPTSCPRSKASTSTSADLALRGRYATLRTGTRGDAVTWLQGRLRAWGAPVPRTGLFRTRTRAAVVAFQRARGLRATGVVDGRTWDLLLQRPRPAEASPAAGSAAGRGGAATGR
jgi:hypothetical protein